MNNKQIKQWATGCIGKKTYYEKSVIEKVIEKTKIKHGIDLYYYKCKYCLGYHLTKRKTKKNIERTKKLHDEFCKNK